MAIAVRGLAPLLEVFDMPRSIAFYSDVLGFEVVSTSEPGDHFDWVLLRLDAGSTKAVRQACHTAVLCGVHVVDARLSSSR